jgi:pantoate--beta-alanine ligase
VIVTRTVDETRAALAGLPRPLGFVPTMGALHAGHLSLVDAARPRCAAVAASVFVNPTQFGAGEDFDTYPRDEARDFAMLEERRVELVFAPAAAEMYPDGFATGVQVRGAMTDQYEGARRPGHFDGMALIVTKLLGVMRPDVLYMGQKDAQQLAVVRRFVRDLDLAVDVVAVPTTREPDGLAMSSRNANLTREQRAVAPNLYAALMAGAAAGGQPHATTRDVVVAATTALLMPAGPFSCDERPAGLSDDPPTADDGFDLDYLAIVDPDTFEPRMSLAPGSLLIAAARLGAVRLIDNVTLSAAQASTVAPDPSAYPAEDATT